MKHEKAFSRNGFYMFVVESNLMLHEHAAKVGSGILKGWLSERTKAAEGNRTIAVLDLACGGVPYSIARMMQSCAETRFHYTGIDINADQVTAAREFTFPSNVVEVTLLEGNAWDLSLLPHDEKFDVIFTGFNTHHATPEEIYCLLKQCQLRLNPGGIYINHDFFRPADTPYLQRPCVNPDNESESFALISDEVLAKYDAQNVGVVNSRAQTDDLWKREFLDKYARALAEKNAPESGIKQVYEHVSTRDYPISMKEMDALAEKAGFELSVVELDADSEPLGQYFQLVTAVSRPA